MHIAFEETSDGTNPLAALPAFQRFQQNVAARCDEPPTVSELREIGSYNLVS